MKSRRNRLENTGTCVVHLLDTLSTPALKNAHKKIYKNLEKHWGTVKHT